METELHLNSIRRGWTMLRHTHGNNLFSFPDKRKVPSAVKRIFNNIIIFKEQMMLQKRQNRAWKYIRAWFSVTCRTPGRKTHTHKHTHTYRDSQLCLLSILYPCIPLSPLRNSQPGKGRRKINSSVCDASAFTLAYRYTTTLLQCHTERR